MNKIQLLGLELISLMISSCSNNSVSSNVCNDVDYIAVLKDADVDENEISFSCMDSKGNFKYEDEFKIDSLIQKYYGRQYKGIPSNIVNGYFTLLYATLYRGSEISNYYPLYKASKHPEIVKGCEALYSVGCMNDGVIPVSKHGERISVIDGSGKTLFTLDPIEGKEIISCDIAFYDGLLRIENEEHKYGFVDKKGNIAIKPQYFKVFSFSEGKALVENFKVGSVMGKYWAKYSVIDTKGNVISNWEDCGPIALDDFSNGYLLTENWGTIIEGLGRYHDGMLLVENNDGRFLFLDAKGNTKFTAPVEVKSVTEYNSKCFVCEFNEGWGIMDFKGKVIIPGQYRNIVILRNGNILCHEHQRYNEVFHLYDSTGKEKSKIECESIDVNGNFIIAGIKTRQDNKTVYKRALLDNELKLIAEFDLEYASFVTEYGKIKVISNYIKSQNP
jgi:hypothetical protein